MALPDLESSFILQHFPRGVATELLVSPEGKVVDCQLLEARLAASRETEACAKTVGKKAVAKPPIGPDGRPVHGLLTGAVVSVPSSQRPTMPSVPNANAVEVTVTKLPKGVKQTSQRVLAFVDETGKLTDCQRVDRNSLIADEGMACRLVIGLSFPIKRGVNGSPVGYVTSFSCDIHCGRRNTVAM